MYDRKKSVQKLYSNYIKIKFKKLDKNIIFILIFGAKYLLFNKKKNIWLRDS